MRRRHQLHLAVTNEGNVTLHDVAVDDRSAGSPSTGGRDHARRWQNRHDHLHGQYQITQADIDAGHFANMAEANSEESRCGRR